MYEKAVDGRLYAFIGEYSPNHAVDGIIDCDSLRGEFLANTLVEGLDAQMLRVMTEEEYYKRAGRPSAFLGTAVIHIPTEAVTDISGKPTSRISVIFNGLDTAGFDAGYYLGLRSKDSNGNRRVNWYSFSSDAAICIGGQTVETSNELIEWITDENGDVTCRFYLQIPASALRNAGYSDIYEAASDGAIYVMLRESMEDAPVDGIVLSGDQTQELTANAAISGRDACVVQATTGEIYYHEMIMKEETSQVPEELNTETLPDSATNEAPTNAHTTEAETKIATGSRPDAILGCRSAAAGVMPLLLLPFLAWQTRRKQ